MAGSSRLSGPSWDRANRDESRLESRSDSGSQRQSRQSRDNRPSRERKNNERLRIVAKSNREVARLSPDDIVCIMQRVGFSDDQILDLGTDLHNALLLSGGAEVYYGKGLEMIFAVNNHQVQIQSRSRGNLRLRHREEAFRAGSVSIRWGPLRPPESLSQVQPGERSLWNRQRPAGKPNAVNIPSSQWPGRATSISRHASGRSPDACS